MSKRFSQKYLEKVLKIHINSSKFTIFLDGALQKWTNVVESDAEKCCKESTSSLIDLKIGFDTGEIDFCKNEL